jgi:hypothetical protein
VTDSVVVPVDTAAISLMTGKVALAVWIVKLMGSELLTFPAASVSVSVQECDPVASALNVRVVVPTSASVVLAVHPPVKAIVPAAVELKVYEGVVEVVVEATPVTSVMTGAVLVEVNVRVFEAWLPVLDAVELATSAGI